MAVQKKVLIKEVWNNESYLNEALNPHSGCLSSAQYYRSLHKNPMLQKICVSGVYKYSREGIKRGGGLLRFSKNFPGQVEQK